MNENLMRNLFKYFNKIMVLFWKLGLEKLINIWPKVIGRFLVITHYGRKSGKKYLTPVNYATVAGEIYCTSGFGVQSDWYKNLIHHPEIEMWMSDGWWKAKAEDIVNHPDRLPIMREVLIGSGFAAPLAGINPLSVDDETLAEKTKDYRLLRLNKLGERTGKDGPNEYGWIWPMATFLLLAILKVRKRKK